MTERDRIVLYKQTFGTESGKKVLELLTKKFDGPSYVLKQENTIYDTVYKEGRRKVIKYITELVNKKID
jgi:hypothetical protein